MIDYTQTPTGYKLQTDASGMGGPGGAGIPDWSSTFSALAKYKAQQQQYAADREDYLRNQQRNQQLEDRGHAEQLAQQHEFAAQQEQLRREAEAKAAAQEAANPLVSVRRTPRTLYDPSGERTSTVQVRKNELTGPEQASGIQFY